MVSLIASSQRVILMYSSIWLFYSSQIIYQKRETSTSLTNLTHTHAIVIGSARGSTSQLTENKEFLFSDYVVTSEEVFKNNSSAYIASSSDVTVTRPGGRVQIKGRTISAVDASFKPLDIGERYLLFLKYLPETGAYKSIRKGSFLIHNDDLISFGSCSLLASCSVC
jgi:hypothetical protein